MFVIWLSYISHKYKQIYQIQSRNDVEKLIYKRFIKKKKIYTYAFSAIRQIYYNIRSIFLHNKLQTHYFYEKKKMKRRKKNQKEKSDSLMMSDHRKSCKYVSKNYTLTRTCFAHNFMCICARSSYRSIWIAHLLHCAHAL